MISQSRCCCPPLPTFKQIHKRQIWATFHEDLLNQGESVGRVADVIQYLLNTIRRPDIPSQESCEYFERGGEINNLDISGKLQSYIEMKIYDTDITGKARERYVENLAADLLRGLRFIEEGKPGFLLPEQDKRNLVEFVSTFAFPPLGKFSRE
jgi:hypothetical protein